MAGYSGTPLPKKLGIKENFRVALVEMPAEVRKELKDALAACAEETSRIDFAMLFVKRQADLKKQFPKVAKQLAPAGMLWVSWPKKTSGVASDLDENVVRNIGLGAGLVDVKVCAVDEVWSGLKFVIRVKDR
jgi:alkylation response protein AidB-like acyl-CoA dehydrogenase